MGNHAAWIDRCVVPGCPHPAGRDGLCINHRLMVRMGDTNVRDKAQGLRSKVQEPGAAEVQLPEDERCRAGWCNRPRYVRGVCAACYTYWRSKARSPRGLRIAEALMDPIPAGERGRRRGRVPHAKPEGAGPGPRVDRKVADFLTKLGLHVIDLDRPGRVVINYEARRAVVLEDEG